MKTFGRGRIKKRAVKQNCPFVFIPYFLPAMDDKLGR